MKISEKLNKEFNAQIQREYASAYLYLSMSSWLQDHGFPGSAHWMKNQYREEMVHAEGLVEWVQLHKGSVDLAAIEAPDKNWDSILAVFEQTLKHEEGVSQHILALRKLAREEADQASEIFLNWYVMEQVEEEDNAENNVRAFQALGNDITALMNYDHVLGKREFHRAEIPYLD